MSCKHIHRDVVHGEQVEYPCQMYEGHEGFHTGERRQCNIVIDGYYCVKEPYHGSKCKTIRMQIDEDKEKEKNDKVDPVNHPAHYTSDPSGIECITITRHRNFNIGNAIKYLWRAGLKDQDTLVQDLRKAVWYIQNEIERIEGK